MTQKHTPEPWEQHEHVVLGNNKTVNVSFYTKLDDNGRYSLEMPHEEQQANAERIVECVNMCAGIETKYLKPLGQRIAEGSQTIRRLSIERKELRQDVERLREHIKHDEKHINELVKQIEQLQADCKHYKAILKLYQ